MKYTTTISTKYPVSFYNITYIVTIYNKYYKKTINCNKVILNNKYFMFNGINYEGVIKLYFYYPI